MSAVVNEVRKGFYLDSVALMRLSGRIAGLPGVTEAALMMGTPANKAILRDAGLLGESAAAAQGNDLVVGIRAESQEAGRAALAEALAGLERPRAASEDGATWRPRSLRAALKLMPDANLALVSVPGDFAGAEARKALRRGLHVMIFSDNVPLAQERALKEEARTLGRLVMGPDCGTALINGVPLGFANKVRRGDIGLVGASGTGLQEVSTLISRNGGGISHAIGTGGRDLHHDVGAITTLMAIDALDADPGTRRVVLISKPPDPEVARAVLDRIARSPKRFTVCFIGAPDPELPANARLAPTLRAGAEDVLDGRMPREAPPPAAAARSGRLLGLYTGGTLAAEAQIILGRKGRIVASNAPVPGARPLAADAAGDADRVLDLGADEFTRGRPHPMIEPTVRDEALKRALGDDGLGAVLIDVVIGTGAHPDPAGHLASVLGTLPPGGPAVIASVTGTEEDPQMRSRQVETLERIGVAVAPSNAEAASWALALSGG